MGFKKTVKVIMLPTNDKTNLIINKSFSKQSLLQYRPDLINPSKFLKTGWNNQHLYFTSDDEIKEGDYYIHGTNRYAIGMVHHKTHLPACLDIKQNPKKIIATTDPEFTSYLHGHTLMTIPQISQSFIEEYCKQNSINKVELEYELYCNTGQHDSIKKDCNCPCEKNINCGKILKLTATNEVIIHLIKDKMYSKIEVESLLFKYAEDEHAWFSTRGEINEFNNWVKKNVQ